MLLEVVQKIYFFGREAAKKEPLGGACGQAPNAIWAFFDKDGVKK